LDAKLAADLKAAEDDLDAGRFYTQEQVEAMFKVRRDQRDAA
jgi:predicted transcriptional regulator